MTDIYDLKKLKLKFLCFSVSVERRMHYLKINFSDFFFISLIFVKESIKNVSQGLISRNEKFGFARAYFAKREIWCALLYSQVHQSCNSFSLFGSFLVRNYY